MWNKIWFLLIFISIIIRTLTQQIKILFLVQKSNSKIFIWKILHTLKGKVWKEKMKYDKKLNLKLSTNLGSDQRIVSWVLERSQWGGQGESDSWMSPGTKAEECGENLPAPHCVYHPLRDALGLGQGQLGLQWCPAEIRQLELYLLAWPLLFMGLRNLSGVMPSIYKVME